MKAYRLEIIIVDHDELGREAIISELEDTKYSNRCISPKVRSVTEADIGEWHDDHPLNKHAAAAELNRIFGLSLEAEKEVEDFKRGEQ